MKEELTSIFQDFSGVERVSVVYSPSAIEEETPAFSLVNRGVCSDSGTLVNVTFDGVSLEVRLAC